MSFYHFVTRTRIHRGIARYWLIAPFVGVGLYMFQEDQRYKFMRKIRERDENLRISAQSIFSDQRIEFTQMLDIKNDQQIDSSIFEDAYTIVFPGTLTEFSGIQNSLEDQIGRYNLHYLFLVSPDYLDNNHKQLRAFLENNPKRESTQIAYGYDSTLIKPNTLYCFRDQSIVYFKTLSEKEDDLPLLTKSLSLKINRDIEKQFVKAVDF